MRTPAPAVHPSGFPMSTEPMSDVEHASLVDRIVAAWQTWRAGNEASAESLDRMREADGMDVESDPIDPEGELCAWCGCYPAQRQALCFTCHAKGGLVA